MEELSTEHRGTVVIVGGGLVGSLDALYFADKGYKVQVYESRPDPREEKYVAGRSINLSLSRRGIESLKKVGQHQQVIDSGIPMYARMIHSHNGKRTPIPYGKKDQHILSVDRRKLNEVLIDVSDERSAIEYHFSHKVISADLDGGRITFTGPEGVQKSCTADLFVGCDGAFSSLRRQILRKSRMDFNQTYIPHGYKEIEMLPDQNGEFKMEPNYLHIWPRNTFMMIALPNQNKSFTCTLFMPYEKFDQIKNEDEILKFFEEEFPDSIPLFGRDKLIKDFLENPVGDMISIKCKPYHYKDNWVIKGDAAHAMVPFYGQGMNCGFQDCHVFSDILEKNNFDLGKTLPEYSKARNPDAEAMCDLAMYNYIEMRAHVNSRLYILRKHLDNLLQWLFPRHWIPLYTMVTFSTIPYKEVVDRRKKQDEVLKNAFWYATALSGLGLCSVFVYKRGVDVLPQFSLPKITFG